MPTPLHCTWPVQDTRIRFPQVQDNAARTRCPGSEILFKWNLSILHVIILLMMHSPQSWPVLHNVCSIVAILPARVFIISPCTNEQPPLRERERIRPDIPARWRFSLMSYSRKKWKIVARCLRKTLYEANSRSPFIMKQLCSDQLPLFSIAIHFS